MVWDQAGLIKICYKTNGWSQGIGTLNTIAKKKSSTLSLDKLLLASLCAWSGGVLATHDTSPRTIETGHTSGFKTSTGTVFGNPASLLVTNDGYVRVVGGTAMEADDNGEHYIAMDNSANNGPATVSGSIGILVTATTQTEIRTSPGNIVSGTDAALKVSGSAWLRNSGSLTATNENDALVITSKGSVLAVNAGSITGSRYGIYSEGKLNLNDTDSGSTGNAGSITGTRGGINVAEAGTATIDNVGTIGIADYPPFNPGFGPAIQAVGKLIITNQFGGVITGVLAPAILLSSLGGSIKNEGYLLGGGGGIRLRSSSNFGDITNTKTITVTGGGDGIQIGENAKVTNITNSEMGMISAPIRVEGTISGKLTNSANFPYGLESVGTAAVIVSGTIDGGFENSGYITTLYSSPSIDLSASTQANFTNSGSGSVSGDVLLAKTGLGDVFTMSGGQITGAVKATTASLTKRVLNISGGTITGGIDLSAITAADEINQSGGSLGSGALLSMGILGKSGAGQKLNITGSVTTAGTISNIDTINIDAGKTFTVNYLISGAKTDITNSGSMIITPIAPIINAMHNQTGGTVTGPVSFLPLGELINFGSMTSTIGNTVTVNTGSTMGNITNNTGGNITNTAAFSASPEAGNAIIIENNATVTTITNNDNITSTNAQALLINGSVGTLLNSLTTGVITSTNSDAIVVGSTGIITGVFTNTGAINAYGAALSVSGTANTVNNTGSMTSTNGIAVQTTGTGTITGGFTNSGTITRSGGIAIDFSSSANANFTNTAGTVTGNVLLAKANTGNVLTMMGGTITGTVSAPTTSTTARKLSITSGEIQGGINLSLSTVADEITQSGGTTGAITGKTCSGQFLKITGTPVSTSGDITNIDKIVIDAGKTFTVKHLIKGDMTEITNSGILNATTNATLSVLVPVIRSMTNNLGAVVNGSIIFQSIASPPALCGGPGALINQGSMIGDGLRSTVDVRSVGLSNLNNSGSITNGNGSFGYAIEVGTGATVGTLTNTGTVEINGSGILDAIYIGTGGTVNTLTNSGTITARQSAGLALSGTIGTLTNNSMGTISCTNPNPGSRAIYLSNGNITNGFTNAGLITGVIPVLMFQSTIDQMTNTGNITSTSGATGTAVWLYDNAATITNGLTNSGTITGNVDFSASSKADFTNNVGTAVGTGKVNGNVLLAKTGSFNMNGGMITGSVSAGTIGTSARTLNITNGEIQGGINLSNNQPDIINQSGGKTGTITGNIAVNQSLNILGPGPVTTSGNIANVQTITITNAGDFNVNHRITGANTTLTNAGTLTVPATTANDPQINIKKFSNSGPLNVDLQNLNFFSQIVTLDDPVFLAGGIIVPSIGEIGYHALEETYRIVNTTALGPAPTVQIQPLSYAYQFEQVFDSTSSITIKVRRTSLAFTPRATSDLSKGPAEFLDLVLLEPGGVPGVEVKNLIVALRTLNDTDLNIALKTLNPITDGSLIQLSQDIQRDNFEGLARYIDEHRPLPGVYSAGDVGTGREVVYSRGAWAKLIGARNTQKPGYLNDGYEINSSGLTIGYDQYCSDRVVLGVALGYAQGSSVSKLNPANEQKLTSLNGMGYATVNNSGPSYIDGILGFGMNTYDLSRQIGTSTSNILYTAKARFQGWHYGMKVESGYRFSLGKYRIIPSASLRYSALNLDDYQETGAGGVGRNIQAKKTEEGITGLGIRFNSSSASQTATYVPELRFNVYYDWIGQNAASTGNFLEPLLSGPFILTTPGFKPQHATYNMGVSLTVLARESIVFVLNYELDLKNGYVRHAPSMNFRWEF